MRLAWSMVLLLQLSEIVCAPCFLKGIYVKHQVSNKLIQGFDLQLTGIYSQLYILLNR